jgi:hypothetical protein
MIELQLIKMPNGVLRAANQQDSDSIKNIANGTLVNAKIVQPRNPKFHRKFFAMLGFFFELWEIPEDLDYKGIKPEKNFDQFRKDILIAAGFRELIVNIKGECRFVASSISFSAMGDDEFAQVYKLVFNTCWRFVMNTSIAKLTPQQAENTINQMLEFDS